MKPSERIEEIYTNLLKSYAFREELTDSDIALMRTLEINAIKMYLDEEDELR